MDTTSATRSPADPKHAIRICKVAGRHLIFDIETVKDLRRRLRTSGTLVGTTPQQPTQNVFLGLPVEITPDEVKDLVQCGAAYVVDIVDAHREILGKSFADQATRSAYTDSLRRRMNAARLVQAAKASKKSLEMTDRPTSQTDEQQSSTTVAAGGRHLLSESRPGHNLATNGQGFHLNTPLGLTLTSSTNLIPQREDDAIAICIVKAFISHLDFDSELT
ncbi:hypothetical protein CP532_5094 [Ophiocordyceps camponoti-leonardi (nom. inval.)]|nr:hypothetical protein CP532_5094 [Ophiocordyceps camponoti-leonardi (nom. inval.)]